MSPSDILALPDHHYLKVEKLSHEVQSPALLPPITHISSSINQSISTPMSIAHDHKKFKNTSTKIQKLKIKIHIQTYTYIYT